MAKVDKIAQSLGQIFLEWFVVGYLSHMEGIPPIEAGPHAVRGRGGDILDAVG